MEKELNILKEEIEFLKYYKIDKILKNELIKIINYYEPNNHVKINVRVKNLNSAILKFKERNYKTIDEIKDLIGIMIICEDIAQIYRIEEYIKKNLNVVDIKDYIKKPKMGYKSLHIKIINKVGIIYEVQIKTKAMQIAQKVVHDNIYKNKKMTNILKKILSPLVFNIIFIYENIKNK